MRGFFFLEDGVGHTKGKGLIVLYVNATAGMRSISTQALIKLFIDNKCIRQLSYTGELQNREKPFQDTK